VTQEAATPLGFWERVEQIAERAVQRFARSGFLRNASITGGGLTIKGGFLRALPPDEAAAVSFFVGRIQSVSTGSYLGTGMLLQQPDGTDITSIRTAEGDFGSGKSIVMLMDSGGRVVLSSDAASGEGVGRPWLPLPTPQPTAIAKWPSTTATSFGNIAECWTEMQHPKLWWNATVTTDSGVSGEVRLSIDGGKTLGPVHQVAAGTPTYINDVIALPAGFHGKTWPVNVQARVTSGTGEIRCQTWGLYGRQT
jgi:hypothetical protein